MKCPECGAPCTSTTWADLSPGYLYLPSTRAAEGVRELRDAIQRALNELGVPQPGYPAPVANVVEILGNALAAGPSPTEDRNG